MAVGGAPFRGEGAIWGAGGAHSGGKGGIWRSGALHSYESGTIGRSEALHPSDNGIIRRLHTSLRARSPGKFRCGAFGIRSYRSCEDRYPVGMAWRGPGDLPELRDLPERPWTLLRQTHPSLHLATLID